MATATAAGKNAQPFPDGTKDYVPLRAGGAKKDATKVHIADTPMTWSNWPQHINWLNTTLVIFVPLAGFISAYWVPLQLKTALWAVFYYVHTGLGITAGKSTPNEALLPKPRIPSINYSQYQVTIDFGLTLPTRVLPLSRSISLLSVLAPFRVPSDGGHMAIVSTTVIPIPTRTPTPSARVSCTPTWAG